MKFALPVLILLALLLVQPVTAQSSADSESSSSPIADTNSKSKQDSNSSKPQELARAAADRLIALQESDGAWPYEGVYRVRRKIPVGYRIGGTAIVCAALLHADLQDRKAADAAILRGTQLILQELEHPLMQPSVRDKYDVRVWGHIFALDWFCRLSAEGLDDSSPLKEIKAKTEPWIQRLVDAVEFQEIEGGGWNYAGQKRHAAFVSATALQSLLMARGANAQVSDEVLQRGANALLASRNEQGAFLYSGKGDARRAKLPGSIARSAACEATLLMLGQGNIGQIQAALDAFHTHWIELEKRRKKTGTHEGPYNIAPYYFYFGHRYAAQAIRFLPKQKQDDEFDRFRKVLLKTMDEDNTWNDRVFDRSKAYGTAMAILSLSRDRVQLPTNLKPADNSKPKSAKTQEQNDDSAEPWIEDIRYLASELPKRHPNPFTTCTKSNFAEEVNQLIARWSKVPDNMRVLELMRLVALLGEGHTAVRPDMSKFSYYPFNARVLDDGIFITFTTAEHKEILGAKLVRIGDKSVEAVEAGIKQLLSFDNEYGFRNLLDKQLNTAEYLQFVGAAKDLKSADFTFEKGGEQFTVTLRAGPPGRLQWISAFKKIPIHRNRERLPFWNDFIKESKTFYFKYNACKDENGFQRLVKGSKGFIAQNDVDKFVLDLRDNGGGNSAIFKPLLNYLTGHPTLDQRGRLFVIVGRGTFSSGLFAAYDMRKTNAVFVGEPTGGKPNHFGEVRSFELPNSKIRIQHSTKYWKFLNDSDPSFFTPDIHVETSGSEYLSGVDPAMEAIQKFEK